MGGWGPIRLAPLPLFCLPNRVAAMSTLWTPGGERPVPPRPAAPPPETPPGRPPGGGSRPPEAGPDADVEAELAELQAELVNAPAEVVVANHAFGLFQLAALHLSQPDPDFVSARLAIDAMGAVVEGLSGRLGPVETDLTEGLAQIRMAFVQVQAARSQPDGPPDGASGGQVPGGAPS
jgi:hypothetical protein